MRRDNPRILANGILVGARSVFLHAQVERVLREAKKEERRVFRSRVELAAFLDPYLSLAERRRRDQFLDENDRTHPSSGTFAT
jgi:hypothetical protein